MSFKRKSGIRSAHSYSVIRNLNQGFSGIFNKQIHARRLSISGIFQQFFDYRSGTLNDFSCSNLIGHMVGEKLNDITHLRSNGKVKMDKSKSIIHKNIKIKMKAIKRILPLLSLFLRFLLSARSTFQ